MAKDACYVLRIPRSDEKGSFILARVTPLGPASRPLNVKLVATEGVAPYVLTLRHDRIDKLRGSNAPCSPDEWQRILAFLLLGQETFSNVDATATVEEESALSITIWKRVQDITQRLGTLSLTYDGDEGIELFDWCGEAVDSRTQVQDELEKALSTRSELEKAVGELTNQLDEFLKAKEADDKVLLEKFCMLLNEKKLKIRAQQQQLLEASANQEAADDGAAAQAETKDEEPAPPARQRAARTRAGAAPKQPVKRGAKRRAAVSEDESDSDGFEKPAPRTTRRAAGKTAAGPSTAVPVESDSTDEEQTTENDDESTESEPGEPIGEDVQVKDAGEVKEKEKEAAPQRARRGGAVRKTAGKAAPPKEAAEKQAAPEAEAPPPRRNLAFGQARKASKPAAAPAEASKAPGSETESDDEL